MIGVVATALAFGLLASGLARADDPSPTPEAAGPTDSAGRVVTLRTLVAPEGGLPDESLEPLLRVRQDVSYSPSDVRQDIALLHRVLDAARIEVDVEEWPGFDADGAPIAGVRVEYRVWPPPRVRRVRVSGNRHVPTREILAATGVDRGDPLLADDVARLERAVRDVYRRAGWPRAAVVVAATDDARRQLSLDIQIDEGEPQRVGELAIRDGGAIPAWEVRWILGRAGLREREAFNEASIPTARDALTRALRARGWWEARVGVKIEPTGPTTDRLAFVVDPRRKWTIVRDGIGLPSRASVAEQLGVSEGVRVGRGFEERVAELVRSGLESEGRLEARVHAEIRESGTKKVDLRLTGDAGPRHRLRDVVFEGETVFGDSYLEAALREASPVLARRRVTPTAVDAALEVLREFFRSKGYLSATLRRVAFEPRPAGAVVPVDVRVAIEPGPRAIVRSLALDGAPAQVDAGRFFAAMVGEPYDPSAADARARDLVEALGERGHLQADARPVAEVSADGTLVDLRVNVVPGPVVYLRTVVLRGYRRTRRSTIQREIDLRPGDPLIPSRVAALRRRLYELEVFNRVEVTPVGDEDRAKDLIIEVEERPNLHFELGGALATDQGIKAIARAGHRNLFGLGHRATLLGQAGFGWVGDGWTLDWLAPEWRAAARYEARNVPGRGERVGADVLLFEQAQEPTFRLDRSGGAISASLRIGLYGTAEVAYRAQSRRIQDVDPGALVEGDAWLDELGLDPFMPDPRPQTPSVARTQSGVDLSLLYDRRDDVFNPTSGWLGSLVVQMTDRLLSDTVFLKAEGAASVWASTGPLGWLFRARAGAGWVPSGDGTLPLEERFRLGGGANLRGFGLDSVGPANRVSLERVDWPEALAPLLEHAARHSDPRWVPTGGDTLALLSAELRLPFEAFGLPSLGGTELAVFGDVGNVWFVTSGVETDSMDAGDPLLRWSCGVGLRRATVIGPIQLDVGFNPEPIRDESWARVHVSLGAL